MREDMIYKQSALDILDDFQSDIENGTPHAYSTARQRMLGLYPRNPKWIPCSERLPEKAGHYLCSFKKANRIDSIYVDLAYWTGGRWYGYLANEINAWMPLPKPWKGVDDESKNHR